MQLKKEMRYNYSCRNKGNRLVMCLQNLCFSTSFVESTIGSESFGTAQRASRVRIFEMWNGKVGRDLSAGGNSPSDALVVATPALNEL